MKRGADYRLVLAAAIALAVLAGAYEAVVRGPLAPPPLPIVPAALPPATLPGGEAAATDTATAAAMVEEPKQEIPADTAMRFTTYDSLAGDTLPHSKYERRYVGTLNGRSIVVQLSVGVSSAEGNWYYRTGRQPHERRLVFHRQRGGQLVLLEDIPTQEPMDADTARGRVAAALATRPRAGG